MGLTELSSDTKDLNVVSRCSSTMNILDTINTVVAVIFALWLSFMDIKKRQLPNKIIVLWLIARLIIVIITTITQRSFTVIQDSVIGAVAIGLILLILRAVTQKALGGGDVKLGIAIGFTIGFLAAFITISIGFILCALYAALRYAVRRNNRNEALPLGPFWFAGIIIAYIIKYYAT